MSGTVMRKAIQSVMHEAVPSVNHIKNQHDWSQFERVPLDEWTLPLTPFFSNLIILMKFHQNV